MGNFYFIVNILIEQSPFLQYLSTLFCEDKLIYKHRSPDMQWTREIIWYPVLATTYNDWFIQILIMLA